MQRLRAVGLLEFSRSTFVKHLKKSVGTVFGELVRLREHFARARRKRQRQNTSRKAFARHDLLRETANKAYPQAVVRYWQDHYGKTVNPLWHVACARVTGKEDVRFIPHDVWFEELLPFFNHVSMRPAYIDKNVSDIILGDVPGPKTVVKRVHGHYYDHDNHWISSEAAHDAMRRGPAEQIIKPSLTDNGFGIRQLNIVDGRVTLDGRSTDLQNLAAGHGNNFIVQAKIQQHSVMAEPHPSSVNTVRLVTFRWCGDIHPLLAFARFGTRGKITDNAGTGGVCCGIDEEGRLNAQAVDEFGGIHMQHPTSGYCFATRALVPNFEAMRRKALELHRKILHFDIVSWDFAVDVGGEPHFLEVNFQGVSYIYQFAAGRPIFGELTEAVLEAVRRARDGASQSSFDPG